jgi:L-aminopeptidase/D-esterase-like protein
MSGSITDVQGIEVGHAQDLAGGTGCTVVLCRRGAVPGVDVRGGAPATRETDCLRPENLVPVMHAAFLTGGSAYGLDCAGGIMRCLEEQGVGLATGAAVVPIVAGAALNDLAFGSPKARPDAAMGYAACRSASAVETRQGNVGAGTGACVGRLTGKSLGMMKGGLGTASLRVGELVVGAIVAVNCNGDVIDPDTCRTLAGTLTADGKRIAGARNLLLAPEGGYKDWSPTTNTTIGVAATNAALTKAAAARVAMIAQDGYAYAIHPVHTMGDGDVLFCMGAGSLQADITRVGALAAWVMAQAIANAVNAAETLHGVPCARELAARARA